MARLEWKGAAALLVFLGLLGCNKSKSFSSPIQSKPAVPEAPAVIPETKTVVVDPIVNFASLGNLRWEFPCPDGSSGGVCSPVPAKINKSVKMGGSAAQRFSVKIRFRGVVEPLVYTGGKASPVDSHFYIGGKSNNPNYNIYRFSVDNPPQNYFLNSFNEITSAVFPIDYTVDIDIQGEANVTLYADAQDGLSIRNEKKVTIRDITNPANVLDGQFVQMDVISVTPISN